MTSRTPLLLALTLAAATRASATVGEFPPSLEPVKDWIGARFDWKERRGKVVVLILFEPEVEAANSKDVLRDALLLDKDEGKNGLTICLVSQANRQSVEGFFAKQKLARPSFPVALDADGTLRSYFQAAVTPYLALVDRDGKIAWEGTWRQKVDFVEVLQVALARPRTVPRFSTTPRFEAAWKAIDKRDPKTAIAELQAIEGAADATPQEKDDAAALLQKIEIEARSQLAAAKRLKKDDELLDALDAFDAVADTYNGLPPAAEAHAAAEAIRKDTKLKKELDAFKTLREARQFEAQGKPRDALEKYRLCATKWKGTKASEKAKKKVDELEKAKK